MTDITRRAIASLKDHEATENGFIYTDEQGRKVTAVIEETEKDIKVKASSNGRTFVFKKALADFPTNGWFLFWMGGIAFRTIEKIYG